MIKIPCPSILQHITKGIKDMYGETLNEVIFKDHDYIYLSPICGYYIYIKIYKYVKALTKTPGLYLVPELRNVKDI